MTNTPRETVAALDEVMRRLDDIRSSLRGLGSAAAGPFDELGGSASLAGENLKELNREFSSFQKQIEKNFSSSLKAAIRDGSGFLPVLEKMRTSIEDLVLETAVVNPALNALFGGSRATIGGVGEAWGDTGGSGQKGLIGDVLGSFLGLFQARAAGGPVNAQQPYLCLLYTSPSPRD